MKSCPRCGALNPQDHKFCGQCGHRFDAPSASEASESLPAWLADMGIEDESSETRGDDSTLSAQRQATASGPQPDAPQAPDAAAQDDLPSWLREAGGDAPAESEAAPPQADVPRDDRPSWLTIDETPPTDQGNAATRASSLEELPPWLNELSTAPPSSTATPVPTTEGDDLPPWLREDSAPELAAAEDQPESSAPDRAGTESLPAWLHGGAGTDDDVTRHAPAPAPAEQADDLPTWLRADANIEPAPVQPAALSPAPQPAIPDWLLEPDRDSMPPADDSLPELPDWSSEFGELETATPEHGDPPWLRESQDAPEPTADAAHPASETEALPAWLVDESAAETEQSTRTPAAPSDDELPAWLAGESSEAARDVTHESAEHVGDAADPATTQALPAWLVAESSVEPLAASAADAGTTTRDDLPAWLRDESLHESSAAAMSAPTEPTTQRESLESPGWLIDDAALTTQGQGSTAGAASESTGAHDQSAPSGPAASDFPSWLAADAEPEESVASAGVRESSPDVIEQPHASHAAEQQEQMADLPAWLTADELATDASRTTAQTSDLPPWLEGIEDEPAQSASSSGLPAWLDEPESAAPASNAVTRDDNLLGELDLPAWLREESATPPPPPSAEPAPTWLQNIAPEPEESSVVSAAVAAPAPKPRIERAPERIESARLLERLRDEPPPEPVVEQPTRPRSRLGPVLLILAVIAILIALGVVLWGPRLGLNFGAAPVTPAAVQDVAAAIAALPAGRSVVVAYEWDVRRLGDLRPLEDAVLGAIESRRDVPLVLLSTDPQGALLADQRARRLLQGSDAYRSSYGLGLANLGFKAGGPVALRRFADDAAFVDLFARDAYGNDLQRNDVVMQAICGSGGAAACAWSGIGLLIIMADDVDDVRVWFEQLRSQHPALPTLLLTTDEVAPQAQPYAAQGATQLLSGLRAADALARAAGVTDERLARRADAVASGGAIWGTLALVGAVPAYVVGRRARRDAEDESWR